MEEDAVEGWPNRGQLLGSNFHTVSRCSIVAESLAKLSQRLEVGTLGLSQFLPVEQILDLFDVMLDAGPIHVGIGHRFAMIVPGACDLLKAFTGSRVVARP